MAKSKSPAPKAPSPRPNTVAAPSKDDTVLVRIDPASNKLSHTILGAGVYQHDNVYRMKRERAKVLENQYVRSGDKSSGRIFLIHTPEEAKAWEALQRQKIRAPRGTTEDPIEFDDGERAVA